MRTEELYRTVTQNIIRELEAGNLPPWLLPFRKSRRTGIMPINAATGRHYNGLNILVLWSEREAKDYDQPLWLTYKQCCETGGQVRKGEKAAHIIYANKTAVKDKDTDEERLIPFLKCFAVFNIQQCDGLPHNEPEPELPEPVRNEQAEAFLAATGAQTLWGEPMAAYLPHRDTIAMPARGAFLGAENLYATWAHESVHWTGHKTRLDRNLKSRFDKEAYAFEELVAEIGAAMTCALLQITGELRHASYVDSWLKVLKNDHRAILTAASMASKATDYLRAFSEPT
jgi:antirestriction protein ArdC